ncbi:MAG TPA: GNAT family N-acetyltransferase [Candidatus Corynebacterium avicola]|uniref:GNAT family N-acetyltransferase n=1 Tax=Candidatus Corynebacterium avicola TaxID=2838527 RepID=A0A9D1RQW1_9CORY|nr:GNAT family N-acetyltransferase [Candidatus Corynebacterium avicola]
MRLLDEHLADMSDTAPEESRHAFDVGQLDQPSVSFWAAREDGELLGVGALKIHDDNTGEVKSMRTAPETRGRGVAAAILQRIIDTAHEKGLRELNLETGSDEFFASAWRLYERHGFVERGPFADYKVDPHSRHYGLGLRAPGET